MPLCIKVWQTSQLSGSLHHDQVCLCQLRMYGPQTELTLPVKPHKKHFLSGVAAIIFGHLDGSWHSAVFGRLPEDLSTDAPETGDREMGASRSLAESRRRDTQTGMRENSGLLNASRIARKTDCSSGLSALFDPLMWRVILVFHMAPKCVSKRFTPRIFLREGQLRGSLFMSQYLRLRQELQRFVVNLAFLTFAWAKLIFLKHMCL